MENQKKKKINTEINSSNSRFNIVNKYNHIKEKVNDIKNYKSLSDEDDKKFDDDLQKNNNFSLSTNNDYFNINELTTFYHSKNEKIHYFSKKLNLPKIFNSSFENYKFFCAYNSFMNNRPYNEDKILISCQKNNKLKIHLFSIFDGHAGDKCCQYLLNNFDKILFSNKNLITNTSKALKESYTISEKNFKELNKPKNLLLPIEKSGSCALTLLNIGKKIYCGNAGDSRALYSENGSKEVYQISNEHKPINEKKRIKKAGGSICRSLLGNIWRLFPGGIAVRISILYNLFI